NATGRAARRRELTREAEFTFPTIPRVRDFARSPPRQSLYSMTTRYFRRAFAIVVLVLAISSSAAAQLFEIAHGNQPVLFTNEGAAAYDPVHDCYFVVSGGTGRFVDRSGAILGVVVLDTGAAPLTRVVYSPDVSDGAGGFGGFLAIWQQGPLFSFS